MACDFQKRLGQRLRILRILLLRRSHDGQTLRQRLDERHAQGPNVARRCHHSRRCQDVTGDFRRIIGARNSGPTQSFPGAPQSIARQFELVAAGHDVGRFNMSVHKSFAMQISEDVYNGIKHLACFRRRQRTDGKNLCKVFFGALHYGIDKRHAAKLKSSHFIKGNQMGMGQFRGLEPTCKLHIAVFRSRRNNFDGCFYQAFAVTALREKYRAVFGSAQIPNQLKLPIDDFTFPNVPCVGHNSTSS